MPLIKPLHSQHCGGALVKAGISLWDADMQRLACFWSHALQWCPQQNSGTRPNNAWVHYKKGYVTAAAQRLQRRIP